MDIRRQTILKHLDYHAWATGKTLDAVAPLTHENLHRDMKNSFRSIWDTLVHIYQADSIWYSRHQGNATGTLAMFPADPTLDGLRVQWADVQARLRKYAEELPDADFERVINYRLLSGAEWASPVYENLLHVVNHGTYHRGQIVTMLRQQDAKGVTTDFIAYLRQL